MAGILLIVATAVIPIYEKEDTMTMTEKVERAMKFTRMKEYHDKDYDFTVRYPGFFEQTPDTLLGEKGCCRFSFWQDSVEIVQNTFVEPNPDSLTVEEGMQQYATLLHATYQRKGSNYFILSGSRHTNDSLISGQRFHVKFVQHRKLWFVTMLTYPEDCEQTLTRLIHEINDWKVWE